MAVTWRTASGSLAVLVLAAVTGCSTNTTDTSYSAREYPSPSGSHARPWSDGARESTDRMPDPSGIQFVLIHGGRCVIGSPPDEPGRKSAAENPCEVVLPSFAISATEVTQEQYWTIVEPGRSISASENGLPITGVTWYEAVNFCNLLTIKYGLTYRLPTEAEWEYACRAGTERMFGVWTGRTTLDEAVASFGVGDPGRLERGAMASFNVNSIAPKGVASFEPNALGLYDMHGNVWEWCDLPRDAVELDDAPSPLHRPIRGGAFSSTNYLDCRCAHRAWQPMNEAVSSIGFRVLREESIP